MTIRMRRSLVAAGVVALVAAAVVSPPSETLASWSGGESGSQALTGKTIPAPTPVDPCSVTNALGIFQSVTIRWSPPAGSGYTAANASVGMGDTVATISPATPQPTISGPAGGPYSATFSSSLLQSLLGGLFGRTFYIGVRSTENGWSSAWTTRTVNVGLLGLGTTCS